MAFSGNFMCTSFKVELMRAVHNFTTSTGNTFKLALYDNTPSFTAATTAYTASGEVSAISRDRRARERQVREVRERSRPRARGRHVGQRATAC